LFVHLFIYSFISLIVDEQSIEYAEFETVACSASLVRLTPRNYVEMFVQSKDSRTVATAQHCS